MGGGWWVFSSRNVGTFRIHSNKHEIVYHIDDVLASLNVVPMMCNSQGTTSWVIDCVGESVDSVNIAKKAPLEWPHLDRLRILWTSLWC